MTEHVTLQEELLQFVHYFTWTVQRLNQIYYLLNIPLRLEPVLAVPADPSYELCCHLPSKYRLVHQTSALSPRQSFYRRAALWPSQAFVDFVRLAGTASSVLSDFAFAAVLASPLPRV